MLEQIPVSGLLAQGTGKKGKWRAWRNTRTQLSFRLTSNPPPGMGSTRCVGAYDQPNSGGFDEGTVDAFGKPKFSGLRDASAAVKSLTTRFNSAAQSMGGRMGLLSSLGGAGLGSTGDDGIAFRRTDRCERDTGFLIELSGAMIAGAMKTN